MITNKTVMVMLEHLKQAKSWISPQRDDEVLFHPKFWPGFLDKTDELRLHYEGFKPPYNVSRVVPTLVMVQGASSEQYITTTCTMIDCRTSLADANKALQVIQSIYAERSEFECQTYPPGITDFAERAANAKDQELPANVGQPGSKYWSAYTTRLYSLSLLIASSVAVGALNVVCYSGCLLLCCREWWCQHPKLKRFQYF